MFDPNFDVRYLKADKGNGYEGNRRFIVENPWYTFDDDNGEGIQKLYDTLSMPEDESTRIPFDGATDNGLFKTGETIFSIVKDGKVVATLQLQ